MEKVLSLAKCLGLVETFSCDTQLPHLSKEPLSDQVQPFDFIIVIDFESTCWDKKNHVQSWRLLPEIIEFPAVLLNLTTGLVESEFHHYVMPFENPKLSDFCTKLTGIQQEQVDSGIPLATCLMLFNQWISQISSQRNISFHRRIHFKKSCTFVTWSDWDLAVCLQNEVKRKQLRRPHVLSHWIDLRALYKGFYNSRPHGLRGALAKLDMSFSGREHSGIIDARNTASLAFRMATDGCILKLTGSATPERGKDEYNLRKQQTMQDEGIDHIQISNMQRKPLATITHLSSSDTPVKLKQPRKNSIRFQAKISEFNEVTDSMAQIRTPKCQQNSLPTPLKRLRTPLSIKRTPPLCRCSRRAVLKVANTPGPNQGRSFYSCSNYRRSLGIAVKKIGCGYFMWC